jgi:tetratricopeptide (TPR) repeat protein/tRNA A-37 threonylcarbamoyl transferase component Bud32
MSHGPATAYEQLSPEEAAQIDAVCDRFERAWKDTRAGGPVPCLASYLGDGHGPAHEALFEELLALDRACQERYGRAVEPEAATHPMRRRAAAPVSRPGDWPHIPGLDLLEVVGSGGMGVVFKGRQATPDRDVAVKLMRDAHRTDPGQRERFLQEARAVARLRHPNLVQVYECGEVPAVGGAPPQPYLVLEYVSGGSLAGLLRGSPQPPRAGARLVETLADAIHYAHQLGVIHRDLKPANVLLAGTAKPQAAEGERPSSAACGLAVPKITDFGLAKVLAGSDLTNSGEVLGTPSYMAPEQAAGKAEPVTVAVDVYGLGAILYECLTGRPPFAAATVVATLGLVRDDEPVPPRRLQPTVPRDLETICLKCLRKEPGRRYATAQGLADDLRRFLNGEPVRARPVGPGERALVWCRRNPGVAALLTALVLVFLAGSLGVLWQWQRARRSAAEARQHAAAFQRERDTAQQEKARAEHHLKMILERVDGLNRLGHDLLRRPGQYRTGQAVLEEALAFYREMLPEEGNDPRVRREAAHLFRAVAGIYFTLGQLGKAATARGREAALLRSLLEEEPDSKALRYELADSYRWQGNLLRDLGQAREARDAYDLATGLHEGLVREAPDEAGYKVALANTLLNKATLLSRRSHAKELAPLYRRILKLNRAAVRAEPDNPLFNAELALALGDQGMLFLETGRGPQAEAAVREALAIYQRLIARGHMKGYIERYAARNRVTLARALAARGEAKQAEQSARKAVGLLDRLVEDWPELPLARVDLAMTLGYLAGLLKGAGRRPESEDARRRAIRHFETLRAAFPRSPQYRRSLVFHYTELVLLLYELGRQTEAAEPYRKVLEVGEEGDGANNLLAWFLATAPGPGLRDAARAVRLAKKAVAARPQSGEYRNTLGVAHYRNGDDRAAVAELEAAMRLRAGGDSFDWFFLAMAHARLGERDKARAWFDRAVQWMDRHKPHNHELRRFRAEAQAMLGEAGKAGP